ncbi:serine/threonine protein kinase [Alishewanella longhuensis]
MWYVVARRFAVPKCIKTPASVALKKAVQYQEGRKVRSSRRARAMEKGSSFGREQAEESWQNAEVDALYKLSDAGVRVPTPYGCYDGVLLMELIVDEDGDVAPRLNDIQLTSERAQRDHKTMMQDILRMLAVGLVHGDLSEFNVLQDQQLPLLSICRKPLMLQRITTRSGC